MVVSICRATRTNGLPCQARALPDGELCFAHDPLMQARRRDGQRRGGCNKSAQARAAKQWAAAGEAISPQDLPAFLRAAIVEVREGRLEPSQASAIATLAKTAIQVSADVEMERRIAALEEAAGIASRTTLRRIV